MCASHEYPQANVPNLHATLKPSPEKIHAMITIVKNEMSNNTAKFDESVKQTDMALRKFQSERNVPFDEYKFVNEYPELPLDELTVMKELCELKLMAINTMLIKKDGSRGVNEELHKFLVDEYWVYLNKK